MGREERRSVLNRSGIGKNFLTRELGNILPSGTLDGMAAALYLASVTDIIATRTDTPPAENRARLVLASASPRRSQILGEAGLVFKIQPSTVDEKTRAGESPSELAERLATEKALDVAGTVGPLPATPVLGADTIVVVGDEVLGKPRDETHAIELLSKLMGTKHQVMTGIALAWSDGRPTLSEVVSTVVEMREASRAELAEYVAVGESLDKAGGYALQGEGRRFVLGVEGSASNVIGLPLEETLALFERAGALEHAKLP